MTSTAPTPPTEPRSDTPVVLQRTPDESFTSANPYARPGYTPGEPSSGRLLGLLSFIGGIASLVFGQTVILPIAAIILGHYARRREPNGRTFGTWGIVLGWFALLGWLAVIILGIIFAAPIFLFAWL